MNAKTRQWKIKLLTTYLRCQNLVVSESRDYLYVIKELLSVVVN